MSKHEHPDPKPPCAHEALKFCAKCDAIECAGCGAEWKKPQAAQMCFREHVREMRRWPLIPQYQQAQRQEGMQFPQAGLQASQGSGIIGHACTARDLGVESSGGGLLGLIHCHEDNS